MNKQAKRSLFSENELNKKKSTFWKTCKPMLSNKFHLPEERIFLLEENKMLYKEEEVANCFNNYFVNITESPDICKWNANLYSDNTNINQVIDAYGNHQSISNIKAQSFNNDSFALSTILPCETYETIMELDSNKKTSGTIPTKILKLAARTICIPLTDCINNCILNCHFPDKLKYADVTPVYKKYDSTDKIIYRPISILPSLSKVLEKILYKQIDSFFEHKLSNLLCGFRKKHGTQHALFKLIQDWQKILDKPEGKVGAILMDLSKAFDCLPHDLLIAKLAAYGFDNNSLLLLQRYLSNRKQRTKIGSYFSSWLEIILGVPQGSILGPLLFNIFINDLSYIIEESKLCNFADDNTIYSCHTSVDAIITNLEIDLSNVLEWFKKNQLAANPDKFQMIVLGLHNRKLCINMGNHNVNSTNEVKLLGLIIDHKLNFNSHINTLCTTASKKLKCLRRIRKYISIPQAKILCNSYIYSTFNYCSLIWMFCSKIANNKINKIHLRTLKTIYLNDESSLYKLLETDNSETIHSRHIKVFIAEIFKSLSNLNPTFMWNTFNKNIV